MKYMFSLDNYCSPDKLICKDVLFFNIREFNYAIRLALPDDIALRRKGCDACCYATDDERRISEFSPVVVVRYNGQLRVDREMTERWLNGLRPYQFYEVIQERGYRGWSRFGFLNEKQYSFCRRHSDKVYQLKRIPRNLSDPGIFWSEEEYYEHGGRYIEKVRGILSKKKFAPFRDITDVEILDFYGDLCSMNSRRLCELDDYYVEGAFLKDMMLWRPDILLDVREILAEEEFAPIRDMTWKEISDFYGELCDSSGCSKLSKEAIRSALKEKLS